VALRVRAKNAPDRKLVSNFARRNQPGPVL
jgi:hypothetical protein